jgi:D-alanine-D-alanine ligase
MRVLQLVGSATSEFYAELSRLYAQDCLAHAAGRHEFHIAYISPDRQWRFPDDLSAAAIEAAQPLSVATAIQRLLDLQIEVALPQMFCLPGMTQYRSVLELLQIPYVGNSAAVMALAANKAQARSVVAAAGVPIPAGEVLQPGASPSLELPIVVKPVSADNSLGVTLVQNLIDLDAALKLARTHAEQVLVEKYVELGREVRCGIIVQDQQLICLPLEEYALVAAQPIRSYASKLRQNSKGNLDFAAKDSTKSWIVDPTDHATAKVWEMAKKCHVALGCRHYSLFDFRIDPQGQPWFLEAGLYCSFAEKSVLSAMSKAQGITLDVLLQDMLANAIEDSKNPKVF